jgi:hypothetical protein
MAGTSTSQQRWLAEATSESVAQLAAMLLDVQGVPAIFSERIQIRVD